MTLQTFLGFLFITMTLSCVATKPSDNNGANDCSSVAATGPQACTSGATAVPVDASKCANAGCCTSGCLPDGVYCKMQSTGDCYGIINPSACGPKTNNSIWGYQPAYCFMGPLGPTTFNADKIGTAGLTQISCDQCNHGDCCN